MADTVQYQESSQGGDVMKMVPFHEAERLIQKAFVAGKDVADWMDGQLGQKALAQLERQECEAKEELQKLAGDRE